MIIRTARLGSKLSRGSELLFRYLRSSGESQYALAKRVGVQDGQINMWLRGDRRPGLEYALTLNALCQIPLDAWGKSPSARFRERFVRLAKKAA